jgi:hypothetical protein
MYGCLFDNKIIIIIIILYYRNQARNNEDILKFYSMEQEITHYSRGKLHVGQITVRESARSTK